jgi:hypothetical protein
MDKQRSEVTESATAFVAGLLFLSPFWLLVLLTWLDAVAVLFVAIGVVSIPGGAVCIWLAVRWFNRRDDPRHAKRPPDEP